MSSPKIEVIFIGKVGCGICMMMKPAWEKLKAEKPEWNYYNFTYGLDSEAEEVVINFPQRDGKMPMWCVFKDKKPIGLVTGGHRYKDIIKMLEDIINVCS